METASSRRLCRHPLNISDILRWADSYRYAASKWPSKDSGTIADARFETWAGVDSALRDGLRGMPGGSSLARLLADSRGHRNVQNLPSLTESEILAWADAYHQQTDTWPTAKSGALHPTGSEFWRNLDTALRQGLRGLPGGSSLAQLLAEHRGVRNRKHLPPLTQEQILRWADAYHQCTGSWPRRNTGPITDAPGETWMAVEMALNHGIRGLPGGSSLAMLLAEHRDAPHPWGRANLTVEQVLLWADAYMERTGGYPNVNSGPISEAPGTAWTNIDQALRKGTRGLAGGSSLAQLLVVERGARNKVSLPRLSRKKILAWADAYFRRHGKWPTRDAGEIPESPGDTWLRMDGALIVGCRGLRGGSTLAKLLAQRRGKRDNMNVPLLSRRKILNWADAHYQRTGKWPNTTLGQVVDAPEERWDMIDNALRIGHRGLPGGSSLLQLLAKKRGVRNFRNLPPLTEEQILHWADLHYQRMGKWPKYNDGQVADASGETWSGIDGALRYGKRGLLPGGSSLAKLLVRTGKA